MAADDDDAPLAEDAPVYGNAELIPITVPPDLELANELDALADETLQFHATHPDVVLVEYLSRVSIGLRQARSALRRRQIEDI